MPRFVSDNFVFPPTVHRCQKERGSCQKRCTLNSVGLMGLQLLDCIPPSVTIIVVNSGKVSGKW